MPVIMRCQRGVIGDDAVDDDKSRTPAWQLSRAPELHICSFSIPLSHFRYGCDSWDC